MFLAFFALLMLNGLIGVLAWLAWNRLTEHLRDNPEAAKLIAEHVIAPLLTGKKPTEQMRDSPGGSQTSRETGGMK